MSEPSRDDVEALIARLHRHADIQVLGIDTTQHLRNSANALTALLALAFDKDTGEKYIERAAISEELRKQALARLAEMEKALEEIASGSYAKCPFDAKGFDPGGPLVPCSVCGDIDDTELPESDPRKGKPSQCHQGGASSRARAALHPKGQ